MWEPIARRRGWRYLRHIRVVTIITINNNKNDHNNNNGNNNHHNNINSDNYTRWHPKTPVRSGKPPLPESAPKVGLFEDHPAARNKVPSSGVKGGRNTL